MLVLLAGSGALLIRHAQGHRHSIVIPVLLVPGLVLGFFEYEDRRADQRITAAASLLAGRPVRVVCERLGASLLDMSSDLGFVPYGPDGRPGDEATITHDACTSLHQWLGSDKRDPSDDQVVAVHVLAHEAEHLAGITSESVAECRSVQSTARAAELLGATTAQAEALARRYVLDYYPYMPDAYRDPGCHQDGPSDLTPRDGRWP